MEFSSSFSIIIFFLSSIGRDEKKKKIQRSLEERIKGGRVGRRGCVSSPFELPVERERKGEREREGEIGTVRVGERERSSERTRERTMRG